MSDKDFAQLRIASPCEVEWNSMLGNDRVRFCEHCRLSVHNVKLITSRKQIRRLIVRSRGRLCINYYQPEMPRRVPPVLYKIGRRTSLIAASAFSATLSISTAVAATTNLRPTAFPNETAYATRLATQSFTSGSGRLFGYVFDPSGAVITGAAVTLTHSETNLLYQSFSGSDGQYQFEGLTAGTYHLKVSSKGFDTSDLPNLSVRENDNNRIDQTLSIAPIEAEVTITAETQSFSGGGAVAIAVASDPLVKAAMDDDLDAVKTLLLKTSDVNVRDKGTHDTALDRAVLNGNREMVQVLLWAKANVNSRDTDGETVLMMIGEDTTSEIVWDLINNGAKVNLRDNGGDTALMSVAEVENVEALKVLLDAGAKVNETNNDGQTALMLAAESGKVHNVRALIMAGADVNARDKEGKTALMYAKENDEPAVVRLLKAHGAIEFEQPEDQ